MGENPRLAEEREKDVKVVKPCVPQGQGTAQWEGCASMEGQKRGQGTVQSQDTLDPNEEGLVFSAFTVEPKKLSTKISNCVLQI